jgi:hypothetical protein
MYAPLKSIAITATTFLFSCQLSCVNASFTPECNDHLLERTVLYLGGVIQTGKLPVGRIGEVLVTDTLSYTDRRGTSKMIKINKEPYFMCATKIKNVNVSIPQDIAVTILTFLKTLTGHESIEKFAKDWLVIPSNLDVHKDGPFSSMIVNQTLGKVIFIYTDSERPKASRLTTDNHTMLLDALGR